MTYLLDVNCLLAAVWSTHADHSKMDAWVEGKELATCAITELGFLRVSTHPKAIHADMASARQLLEDFIAKRAVRFLPCDLPALRSRATTHGAVTDAYLAELAQSKGMKFAALDRRIRHPAAELIADSVE